MVGGKVEKGNGAWDICMKGLTRRGELESRASGWIGQWERRIQTAGVICRMPQAEMPEYRRLTLIMIPLDP